MAAPYRMRRGATCSLLEIPWNRTFRVQCSESCRSATVYVLGMRSSFRSRATCSVAVVSHRQRAIAWHCIVSFREQSASPTESNSKSAFGAMPQGRCEGLQSFAGLVNKKGRPDQGLARATVSHGKRCYLMVNNVCARCADWKEQNQKKVNQL